MAESTFCALQGFGGSTVLWVATAAAFLLQPSGCAPAPLRRVRPSVVALAASAFLVGFFGLAWVLGGPTVALSR